METLFYTFLFIFGTLFGSFASVLIYRLKSGESGIMSGRSHCPRCGHILGSLELIPIFSWLKNIGKCKYCKAKIAKIYPILEISTGILFSLIGYFLIDKNLLFAGDLTQIIKLIFWLLIGFITILYTFYDILFLEIHEGIMASGIILVLILLSVVTFMLSPNLVGILAIILSIIIILGLYIIMIKELKEIWDIVIISVIIGLLYIFKIYYGVNLTDIFILNGIIGALIIFCFFFLQILLSKGAAMGGGDLRIAIMVGLLLGSTLVFPGLMITYIVGSFIGILVIIKSKLKNKSKKLNTQIPFGPFLAIGFFMTMFYSIELTKFMTNYF